MGGGTSGQEDGAEVWGRHMGPRMEEVLQMIGRGGYILRMLAGNCHRVTL